MIFLLSVFCYLYIVILLKFESSQDSSSHMKANVDCYGAFFKMHSCFLLLSWPARILQGLLYV